MNSSISLVVLFLSIFILQMPEHAAGNNCNRRNTKFGYVCVCDSDFCDILPRVETKLGFVQVFETSKSGSVFQAETVKFKKGKGSIIALDIHEITVTPKKVYQEIIGFGGAFTDSFGIVTSQLPQKAQRNLINSYFSNKGSEYNMGRVPIASCDFSTHQYSYDDFIDDFNLSKFSLTEEDKKYKIPYIKEALKLSSAFGRNLQLFGSVWSSPFWMKTNNNMTGSGTLKPEDKYHDAFARYLVRFYEEYKSEGIDFWGTTITNEPNNGLFQPSLVKFQSLGFTSEAESEFLGNYFGPALKKSGFDDLKVMILDGQRTYLPDWVESSMKNDITRPYVSGVAFHWYLNHFTSPTKLDDIKEKYPHLFILSTEACNGDFASREPNVMIGSWDRAERYAADIFEDLLHWTSGWIDWNLALNLEGGPNWSGNFVDSPVIVNATSGEFYKQPTYYVLAHFSKLLPRHSNRIGFQYGRNFFLLNLFLPTLDIVAFHRPDGAIVVHVLNRSSNQVKIRINSLMETHIDRIVPAFTLQSYVWALDNQQEASQSGFFAYMDNMINKFLP